MSDTGVTETPFKVFVSRLPLKWTNELMHEHFVTMGFGDVASVEIFVSSRVRNKASHRGVGNICYAFKNDGKCDKGADCPFSHELSELENEDADSNLGSGVVYFHTEDGMNTALQQGSLHLSHKIVKISPFQSSEDGRDQVTCFAWKKFQCTHGDTCKFSHDGPGGCEKVGVKYQGRKFQCLSFRKTGKCSKGDSCLFIHLEGGEKDKKEQKKNKKDNKEEVSDSSAASSSPAEHAQENDSGKAKAKGICHTFKKKGKCRKGDRCPFSHILAENSQVKKDIDYENDDRTKKRRRIDGSILVAKRGENSKIKFD